MTNIITELLRATPIDDMYTEGYLGEYFKRGEWYRYFIKDSVIYVQGRTKYHKVGFEKEEFESKFIVRDFYDLSHLNIIENYKELKRECINYIREYLQIDDTVYINIINSPLYFRFEINDEDAQDMTLLKILKNGLSIIDADHSGKYHLKKNRIDMDVVDAMKRNDNQFRLLEDHWNKWLKIYEKYYEDKYVYNTEGEEY